MEENQVWECSFLYASLQIPSRTLSTFIRGLYECDKYFGKSGPANNSLHKGTCCAPTLCGSPTHVMERGFVHRPVAFTSHLKVRKVKNLHSKHSWQKLEPPVSV